jgi:hypothetical protein
VAEKKIVVTYGAKTGRIDSILIYTKLDKLSYICRNNIQMSLRPGMTAGEERRSVGKLRLSLATPRAQQLP